MLEGNCYVLDVCVPPKFRCWHLVLFGGIAFGRWLGHEGRAFMNRISALIKETPQSSLLPRPSINQEVGPCQTLNLLVPWSWTSQRPELSEINVSCLSHSDCDIPLQQPKWSNLEPISKKDLKDRATIKLCLFVGMIQFNRLLSLLMFWDNWKFEQLLAVW